MEGRFRHHRYPMIDTCTATELLMDDRSSSLGFMELLNETSTPSIFDVFVPPSDQVLYAPETPNTTSSVSSESNDHERTKEEDGDEENTKKTPKKPSRKRLREPRFAFMTKSEVDHLEDGYRWRKYGQKAVKNSPFPRSYYRCTNPSCNVKKRVERCSNDPTTVVTTYEGQHTHPSPQFPRLVAPPQVPCGGAATHTPPPHQHNQHLFGNSNYPSDFLVNSMSYNTPTQPSRFGSKSKSSKSSTPSSASLTDHGLLQDVVPWSLIKKEEQ